MLKQLPYRDGAGAAVAHRESPTPLVGDRRVEPQLALLDELHHQGGEQHLGDAGQAEACGVGEGTAARVLPSGHRAQHLALALDGDTHRLVAVAEERGGVLPEPGEHSLLGRAQHLRVGGRRGGWGSGGRFRRRGGCPDGGGDGGGNRGGRNGGGHNRGGATRARGLGGYRGRTADRAATGNQRCEGHEHRKGPWEPRHERRAGQRTTTLVPISAKSQRNFASSGACRWQPPERREPSWSSVWYGLLLLRWIGI